MTLALAGGAFRWGVGLAVALTLHLLGALALYSWRHLPEPPPEIPPAIMIDLEPLPTPPVAAALPPPPEIAPPDEAPPVEVPPPPIDIPPPPVVAVQPVIEAPPPPPKPVTRHSPAKKPPRPVVAAPQAPEAPPEQAVVAAPSMTAPLAPPAAAPASNPVPSFRALMAAHLERYKRYPRTAQQRGEEGTVMLRFTIDRKGAVLAAQIDQKSGNALLDEEVLALVRRAEPLPPIPADMPQTELELVVPVNFRLH